MNKGVHPLTHSLMDWPLYVNDIGVVSCRAACCRDDPWTPTEAGRRCTTLGGLVDALAKHMAEGLQNYAFVGQP